MVDWLLQNTPIFPGGPGSATTPAMSSEETVVPCETGTTKGALHVVSLPTEFATITRLLRV